jgi:hypothetical protein
MSATPTQRDLELIADRLAQHLVDAVALWESRYPPGAELERALADDRHELTRQLLHQIRNEWGVSAGDAEEYLRQIFTLADQRTALLARPEGHA